MAKDADHSKDDVLDEAVEQFLAAQWREEKPDLDAFVQQYPGLEEGIRRKVQACQRVGSLFDSIREADETEFRGAGEGADLVGQQIGAFQITEVIGRGGMGIVYKGHDTRLDRTVAIKAMPSHLAEDASARTRFRREATLLASLNHANIGVIYDIIEQDEGAGYLVLEYVPGETLAERIARGAIKVPEALSIALQIAEAVAAAHESGVIHRDLKPGNMMTTPEGRVKVLDFGLGKTFVGEATTVETAVTQPGRVIGTPAYMSPEQARGKPADRRTDIWSFGCVLYEMLTGRLPFEGETATDTLARIIERDPDWDLLPQTTPSNIRVLLRRCLAKEPHRRLQHMGDAVLEIEETLTLPAGESGIGGTVNGRARRRLWWIAAACAFVGLAVGLIAAGLLFRGPDAPLLSQSGAAPMVRAVIELPDDHVLGAFRSSAVGLRLPAFAVSPDGLRLVYVADVTDGETRLFLRMMDESEVRPIPETDGASAPFFSPDGLSVGFFAGEKLKTVSLLGGEPVTICDAPNSHTGDWGPDGIIYFADDWGFNLCRVPAARGSKGTLGTSGYRCPQVLPDGKTLLVSPKIGIMLVSLETMEKTLLIPDGLYARYVPTTGHIIYVRAGAVEAVPFSLATLQVTGKPAPVIKSILSFSLGGTAQFAFSNNGLLVYASGSDVARSRPVWVDRQGNEESIDMPVQNYGTPKVSPDGERLAIVVNEPQSNIYVYDIATGRGTRLTLEGNNTSPVWTPDGKRVTFSRRDEGEGTWRIFWKLADGSGKAELLHSSQHTIAPNSWSPDGKLLAFVQVHPESGYDIWILALDGVREPRLMVGTEFGDNFAAFSPDGRWIAYMSKREGESRVYVGSYPTMDRPIPISYGPGEQPIWSPNGDEIFYRSRGKWVAASISTEPEFTVEDHQVLFERPYLNVSGMSYDVAPRGQRFLALKPQYDDSQIRRLHVVTNWFEELKRLAPSPETP